MIMESKSSLVEGVKENSDGSFIIPSESEKGKYHLVRRAVFGNHWVCDCPAFLYRKLDSPCKHISALTVYLEGKKHAENKVK